MGITAIELSTHIETESTITVKQKKKSKAQEAVGRREVSVHINTRGNSSMMIVVNTQPPMHADILFWVKSYLTRIYISCIGFLPRL
ncbi:unnamed protein product [Prunus brigantina]